MNVLTVASKPANIDRMATPNPTSPAGPRRDPYVEDLLFRAARDFAVTDAKWSVILRHYGISDAIPTGTVSCPSTVDELFGGAA